MSIISGRIEMIKPECYLPPCFAYVFDKGVVEGEVKEVTVTITAFLRKRYISRLDILSIIESWRREHKLADADVINEYTRTGFTTVFNDDCDTLLALQSFLKGCNSRTCKAKMGKAVKGEVLEDLKNSTQEVIVHVGEPCYWEIKLKDKVYRTSTHDLLIFAKFSCWYFDNFFTPLWLKPTEWDELLILWGQMAEKKDFDELADDLAVVETITVHLKNVVIVNKIEETVLGDNRGWLDDGTLFVPNQSIKRILEREKIIMNLRRLRVLLDNIMKDSTTVRKVDNVSVRFWQFDYNKITGGAPVQAVSYKEDDAAPVSQEDIEDAEHKELLAKLDERILKEGLTEDDKEDE